MYGRLFAALLMIPVANWAAEGADSGVRADVALKRLMEGNKRYVASKSVHPDQTSKRRREVAQAQHPYAVVLGCSDSRVPPELVFDEGLGDLFVIRDAGHVVDDDVLGSIEYAVEHLHVNLVLVLGHEKCGAVQAAASGQAAHGHVVSLVKAIQPAVDEARKQPGDLVHNCVIANALRSARLIRESEPVMKHLVDSGKVKVVAADYDLATGKVILLK